MPTEMKEPLTGADQSAEAADLDPNALDAIRSLIETQNETEQPAVAEATVRQAQEITAAHPAPPPAAPKPAAPVEVQQTIQKTAVSAPPAKQGRIAQAKAKLKAKVFGYRPTSKHIMLGALTLLVLFRPWLVVGLVLMSIFTFVCVLLILGYDGFWQRSMAVARWYAKRRPSRATEIHRKLDSFAVKWDAVLDRFPEGTVDALYLPDFGDLAVADKRHEEAMDRRLATLREGEA